VVCKIFWDGLEGFGVCAVGMYVSDRQWQISQSVPRAMCSVKTSFHGISDVASCDDLEHEILDPGSLVLGRTEVYFITNVQSVYVNVVLRIALACPHSPAARCWLLSEAQ
jgi:hypothetical protein